MSAAYDSQLSTLSAALEDDGDRSGQDHLLEGVDAHQHVTSMDHQHVDAGPSEVYDHDWSSVYPPQSTEPAEPGAWPHDPDSDPNARSIEATLNGTADQLPEAVRNGNGLVDPALDHSEPPRKKARKRGSTAKGKTSSIIEPGMVTEYEDPSGDFRTGVVYVHAGPTASQACMRCHAIKRKCDNARPRCAGCTKADEACAYEMNPATTAFVINLKEEHNQSRQRLKEAEERISQLEAALGAAGRACPPRDAPHSEVDPDMAGLAHVKANSAGNVQGRTLSPAGGDDPDRGPDPSSLLSQVQ